MRISDWSSDVCSSDLLKPGEFSTIVARNGGRENAFTTQDYTGYFQSVAVDRLDLMMKLEADRMTGLRLTDEDIEPERLVVLEERRGRSANNHRGARTEEHTTELQYPMRNSDADFIFNKTPLYIPFNHSSIPT